VSTTETGLKLCCGVHATTCLFRRAACDAAEALANSLGPGLRRLAWTRPPRRETAFQTSFSATRLGLGCAAVVAIPCVACSAPSSSTSSSSTSTSSTTPPTRESASSAPAPIAASAPAGFVQIAIAEDARSAGPLRLYADDPDPRVRARAARALGRVGEAADIALLATLAKDPEREVAVEALFAIGLVGVRDAAPAVAALGASSDAAIRAAAVEALGRSSDDADAAVCAQLLGDADARVRGAAALAVGRLAGERFAGKRTLGEEGVAALVDALAKAAAAERDADARWREVYALASLRSEKARRALLIAATDGQPLVRLFAVRGLGRLPDGDELRGRLAERAGDPDDRVAAEAAVAIARHPSKATGDAIVKQLDRPAAFVRRAAARAMGGFASEQAAVDHALAKAKADASASVAAEAAASRARAGFPDAAEWIAEALDDDRALVREKAAAEAASLPDAEKAEALALRGLQDRAYTVAAAAAGSLAKLKDASKARELAYRALKHPRGLVRENAAGALEELSKREGPVPFDDVEKLLFAAVNSRGDDLAESRASIVAALETVETARRARAPSVAGKPERADEVTALAATAFIELAADSDPTVQAKLRSLARAIAVGFEAAGGGAPPAQIPGVNAPRFARDPRVRVKTSRGAFEATLFSDDAPVHVENFLRLAAAKHYDRTPFHRVEINFVVQGGDHLGDGTGARAAWGGCLRDEINRRPFVRGTLGMPKSDVADSGGCQIFAMHVPAPHLDGRYTAFGQVDRGVEVLDALEVGDRIESVEVIDDGR